jgi:hypothetical protein
MADQTEDKATIGYGRPPKATRFSNGRSGNPKGRPKGSKSIVPYEKVLGRKVLITEKGVQRTVSAAEAFLLHMAKQGLSGKVGEASDTLSVIQEGQVLRGRMNDSQEPFVVKVMASGNPNIAMFILGMARKLSPYRPTSWTVIEPWMVEAALSRFGGRRLSLTEQEVVMQATRTPLKVKWPDWWEAKHKEER